MDDVLRAARQTEIRAILESKTICSWEENLLAAGLVRSKVVTVREPAVLVGVVSGYNTLLFWGQKSWKRQWVLGLGEARWMDSREHMDYWTRKLTANHARRFNILFPARRA